MTPRKRQKSVVSAKSEDTNMPSLAGMPEDDEMSEDDLEKLVALVSKDRRILMEAADLRQLARLIPAAAKALVREAEFIEARRIGCCGTPMFCRNIAKCVYPNENGVHCNCDEARSR